MANKTYYSVTETAVFLRKALAQAFPGVKFSVKSKSYSGGASINVSWTDGPLASDVKAVTDIYEGATFDGMIDLKSYRTAVVMDDNGPREVHYGADFIFEHRALSAEMTARVYGFICRKYGVTPRENAVRVSSWGAELTNDASMDRLHPTSDWAMHTVRDAYHQIAAKAIMSNGVLAVLKG